MLRRPAGCCGSSCPWRWWSMFRSSSRGRGNRRGKMTGPRHGAGIQLVVGVGRGLRGLRERGTRGRRKRAARASEYTEARQGRARAGKCCFRHKASTYLLSSVPKRAARRAEQEHRTSQVNLDASWGDKNLKAQMFAIVSSSCSKLRGQPVAVRALLTTFRGPFKPF